MRKVIYPIIIFGFLLSIYFQDSYIFYNPSKYPELLINTFHKENYSDVLGAISLYITISLGVIGFSLAILGLTFSRSKISFSNFAKYVSPYFDLKTLLIILSLNFIFSLFLGYYRYTVLLDIWMKILLIPVFDFLIQTIKSSIYLEKIEFMKTHLRKNILKKKVLKASELFLNVIVIAFPNEAYEMLYQEFNEYRNDPEKLDICYEIHNKIYEETKNGKN